VITERHLLAILITNAALFLASGHALRAEANVPNQTKQDSSTADATISRLNLPDPLIMNGGQPVTTVAQWTRSSQAEPPAMRQFSKAKSLAVRLDICPRTIFRWADQGMITRHKINARVVLFDEAEVVAFIESARVG
jgi:hypothetical protein